MSIIESKNISIVVQGPVIGKESDPIVNQFTKICIDSLRAYFPQSEIVLSTWSEVSPKWIKFDKLVVNEEPPPIERIVTTRKDINYNGNRLICTTANGIKASTRDYVLKVRSDIMFTSNLFLESLSRYPVRNTAHQISEHRIVIPELLTSVDFFSINDWVSFGTRNDQLRLWDIPYMQRFIPLSDGLYMNNEQYVCYNFLKSSSIFSLNNPEALERLFANNFLILNADSYSFQRLKPFPYSMTRYFRWTSHYDWNYLYKTYCLQEKRINFRKLIRPTVLRLGELRSSFRNKINGNQHATA